MTAGLVVCFRRPLTRATLRAAALTVLLALTFAGPATAVPSVVSAMAAATAEPGDATSTTAEPVDVGGGGSAAAPGESAPVVLLGVPGLLWTDLDPVETPALWELAGRASTASMSVRTVSAVTCPLDGWLMVSTGRRAQAAPPIDDPARGTPK